MSLDLAETIALFERELGTANVVHGEALASRNPGYCETSLDAGIVLLPRSTDEVARICALIRGTGLSIVPQGGLTGLVQGLALKEPSTSHCSGFRLWIPPEQAASIWSPRSSWTTSLPPVVEITIDAPDGRDAGGGRHAMSGIGV